jgi:hypothetical protein
MRAHGLYFARGFLITKEKPMLIDRTPPPIEDIARRLAQRTSRNGPRPYVETIPPDVAHNARSRRPHPPREIPPLKRSRDSGLYTPELSARLDDDPNLTDGARRCARIIAAYTYRRSRDSRTAHITVTYLARAMDRSSRTIQRYLRQLEQAGYITTAVVAAARTRLCVGLMITLLRPFFPKHHAAKWPARAMNSAATMPPPNHRFRYKTIAMTIHGWIFHCLQRADERYMKTLPPLPAFPTA